MMPGFILRTVRLGGQCLNWRGAGIIRRWTRSSQRGVTLWAQAEAVTLTCEPSIVFSRPLEKQAAEVSGGKSGEAVDRVAGGGSQRSSKPCCTRASPADSEALGRRMSRPSLGAGGIHIPRSGPQPSAAHVSGGNVSSLAGPGASLRHPGLKATIKAGVLLLVPAPGMMSPSANLKPAFPPRQRN